MADFVESVNTTASQNDSEQAFDNHESSGRGSASDGDAVTTPVSVDACSAATAIINQEAGFINEDDSTLFHQVIYLGCSKIDAPRAEEDIQKVMAILNTKETQENRIDVVVSIATHFRGYVRLYDATNESEIQVFPINRILFCARGHQSSTESCCFAFTTSHGNSPQSVFFQCHVFRCLVPEAVSKVLLCFAAAFRPPAPLRNTSTMASGRPQPLSQNLDVKDLGDASSQKDGSPPEFLFELFLEMKEEDGKGGYTLAPIEKNCFKLRRGREKKVIVALHQLSGPKILVVQKCFGLLLAAGRNVRHSDMHLLDMQSMGRGNDDRTYIIEALWDPNSPNFEVLNTETPKDTRVFMTVAADVVLTGLSEPVRYFLECKARIFHEHERFWYITRKPAVERFILVIEPTSLQSNEYQLLSLESSSSRDRKSVRQFTRSPSKMASNLVTPAGEDDSDSDEPLLSGSGDVCKEYSEDVLADWGECLRKWRLDNSVRPKELSSLIRNGIPDALRGEVWQLLSRCDKDPEMMDTYRLLLAKECVPEIDQTIVRDIHRTFPAHDYFKEAGGVGQDALYKLSKAYSLYDEEVGYCQGLSFLAASLLLHMPEEQAFGVLVKIMFDYSLRELFKQGFEALHLRFYQLERLIEDYIPDLYQHLMDINVETHMFASQWFLTLFTAKFPLSMVYHIVDLFLSEGINTIFHIALALLKASKKDMLQLDFEGALKYFRVSLPRKYRTDAHAKDLIQQAVKLKISHKRLSKYEKEYIALKQQEVETQDPLERFERENLRLKDNAMRLERENDDLAHELVTSKIQLRNHLDTAEDTIETLQKQVEKLTQVRDETEEDNKRLLDEAEQVKDLYRKELQKFEEQNIRSSAIISNYKQICSDLSNRLEKEQALFKEQTDRMRISVKDCGNCSQKLLPDGSFANNSAKENGVDTLSEEDLNLQQRCAVQEEHVRRLELELAQTKLALVESQCRTQDLMHQLSSAVGELQERKNTWLNKTLSSIKEVTKNPSSVSKDLLRKDSTISNHREDITSLANLPK